MSQKLIQHNYKKTNNKNYSKIYVIWVHTSWCLLVFDEYKLNHVGTVRDIFLDSLPIKNIRVGTDNAWSLNVATANKVTKCI